MTISPITLDAAIRPESGKGAARRARAAGNVPAVVYGPGKPSVSIVVNPKQLTKALTGPLRRNQFLELDIAGQGKRHVMVRDLQFHPVKRHATHVDFLEVTADVPVAVNVPIEVTGKSKAITDGGKLSLISRTISLYAKPTEVPEKVLFDVSQAGFGVIRAKQMNIPENTTLADAPETPLVSIKVPRGEKEALAEGEAAAATAAAAPGDKKGGAKK